MVRILAGQAHKRIEAGLRPRTSAAYTATFKLFLAFVIYMGLTPPYSIDTIVLYLEFLAQKNFKACSLRNNVSVLKHFFALFNWPLAALSCRKVQLLLKSVQMNARMNIKVKGVISISMLQKLIKIVQKCYNGVTYKALFLMAYFGFFRLASLVPPTTGSFDKTRYFTVNDVVWGQPGAHIIVTCAKNMQNSGQYHVVQLPQLKNVLICPVLALKNMLKKKDITPHQPLFQIHTKKGIVPLIASNARSFLKTCIATMGLNPSHFTFHSFRRSGASLAFDSNVALENIKQHGNWKSEAVWTYLNSTPTAASIIPHTFQNLIN